MGLSLRTKLVLAIGIPLLAAYLGMVWLEYGLGRRQALASMEAHLTDVVARQAAELDGKLDAAQDRARTLALVVAAQPNLGAETIRDLLQASLRDDPGIYGMCMAFERNAFSSEVELFAPYYCRDGRDGLRYVDIAAQCPDYVDLDWYRPARLGSPAWWTEPYFDTGIGERLMCTYSAPFHRQGEFRGLVTVDLLSDDLLDDIERVEIGSGYCFLISRRGTFVSHPDASLVMRETIFGLAERSGLEELSEAGRAMVAGDSGARKIRDYETGEPKWIVYAPVPSSGWSLAAVLPESEVMAPIRARLARFLGILVAGLAVIVGIVLLVSVRVTRPIARLTAAAESVARGNLDARVAGISGRDEVARLARTFNGMVADLKTNIDARLREEAARQEVEGELRAAREIQASLLPSVFPAPEDHEFALHAINAPAKMVAGDFFDFFWIDQRRLALVIADVSGKGIPAAVYMAVARTKLRDFASPEKTPAEVVAEVNRSLAQENDRGMFVTLFVGYYDVRTGELEYVNAGHNPPYVVRAGGPLETLDPTGPLVAAFPDAKFCDARRRLEPCDLLVLFTDGVTEAHSDDWQLFGEERLERLLQEKASGPVVGVCEAVIDAVNDFSRGDLKDDVTVLALRRTGNTLLARSRERGRG